MEHHASKKFWDAYNRLPEKVQANADSNFLLLRSDPFHPSLHFKKIGRFWSVRVGLHYRALGIRKEQTMLWFWIGSHAEYDKLIS